MRVCMEDGACWGPVAPWHAYSSDQSSSGEVLNFLASGDDRVCNQTMRLKAWPLRIRPHSSRSEVS